MVQISIENKAVTPISELGQTDMAPAVDPGEMRKLSVVIAGHRTSVSLENAFWNALKSIAVIGFPAGLMFLVS